MNLLSMSSCSSLDKAPARCLEGHGFDSYRGLRFFLCPTLVSHQVTVPSSKFTILIHLSPICDQFIINLPLTFKWRLCCRRFSDKTNQSGSLIARCEKCFAITALKSLHFCCVYLPTQCHYNSREARSGIELT